MLLPNTTIDEALTIAERLRAGIAEKSISVSGFEFNITASFGCAVADSRVNTIDSLIKAADERLYEAKRFGRNRVCGPRALTIAT